MYSTCLFCNVALGVNESIEHFPVGRRLAFDSAKSRLWVICPQCERWNLSPFDERLEAIEECERAFRATIVRVSTDNIGLARIASGLELVRIGSPLRPEFAAWRYGRHFRRRRRRSQAVAVAGVAGAAAAAAVFMPVAGAVLSTGALATVLFPAVATIVGTIPVLSVAAMREYMQHNRVVARFVQNRRVLTVREKHLVNMELRASATGSAPLLTVHHDDGWRRFEGVEAMHAMGVILAGSNRSGATDAHVQSAVREIEHAGDAEGFLATASIRNNWRNRRVISLLNDLRALGALHLSATERLALKMAVHEEAERRAMHGELDALAAAWRDAEVIAKIADEELTPMVIPLAVQPR